MKIRILFTAFLICAFLSCNKTHIENYEDLQKLESGMELDEVYFLDTYALIEIIEENPNYSWVKNISNHFITDMNLLELYNYSIKKYGENYANMIFEKFENMTINWNNLDIISQSNLFKIKNKKINLSYVDCVGYILAKKLGIKFVTGDKEFKNMKNVLFLK